MPHSKLLVVQEDWFWACFEAGTEQTLLLQIFIQWMLYIEGISIKLDCRNMVCTLFKSHEFSVLFASAFFCRGGASQLGFTPTPIVRTFSGNE